MADIVSIGIALDTGPVLTGARQVDAALKSVATASATTAQATQKLDQASKIAGQALTTESQAAQAMTQALRQTAQASTAASQAAQAAAKAAQSVADALRQTGQAAQGASQQLGGIGSALRSFASQTGSFALAQAGVLGLQAALSTAKDAIVDLVKTGITMQNLRTSFAAVSGGATAGAKDFQFVVKTANQLGLSLQSVAEQYRSLSAATRGTTLQGADTRELFTTLSRAAQAYGLSTEQLGRAMTAFQQIISKGKVSMEELRGQLGEAIPGAMQIAARAYGTNTQALEGMIEKGVAAEGFVRRFMGQLAAEVPPAAARAGDGIKQFGNEIVLLKDRIAQSPLITWIDTVIGKLAELLRLGREGQEKIDRAARREATREVGGPESMDALAAKDAQKLTEKTKELRAARAALLDIEKQREAARTGTFPESPGLAIAEREARQEIARLTQERMALLSQGRFSTEERQELAAQGRGPKATYGFEGYVGKEKIAQGQQVADLDAFLKKVKDLDDAWRKAEEAQIAAKRVALGRDPTAEEKAKLGEKYLKDAEDLLETHSTLAAQAKDDPALKALRARGQAAEAQTKGLVDAKKATQEAAEAETKRQHEAEAAAKQKEQEDEEYAKKSMARLKELDAADEQSIEQLRRMAAQYTEVKTSRDADTASQLAQSLATSQYDKEAQKHLKTIQDTTKALEDRAKAEEKVPKLREEAEASAGALRDIERLQKQLEPSRRGMSRAEQLAATRAELAARSKGDVLILEQADKQIKETLDRELWDKWEDVGLNALDHVGDAIADFALKGKLTFKDMLGSIADDLFRFATEQLFQSATKKGGWLDLGFQALSTALGVASAASGAPTEGQAGFIGPPRRQAGGAVSAGSAYMVGEAGPELFVPRQSGTVLPHGQGVAQTTVVNVHVSGVQDAQSFVQSRGAVSRAMMGALAQARQQM